MLQKSNLNINFAQGLDTKTDPWQVTPGKFLSLVNSIFTKGGLLQKRNGYQNLTTISNAPYLTTLNGNLTAIGNTITAYSADTQSVVTKGTIAPMQVSTLPMIRNSINQIQCDSVVAANGLVCVVYSEQNSGTTVYKYAVLDSITGQNIVSPVVIPVSSGTVTGSPRVFLLGPYFVIVFTNVITAVSHLQYISISSAVPTVVTTNQDIAASYISATTLSWDGVVTNGNLYVGYNTTSGGQSVKVVYLTQQAAALGQTPSAPVSFAGSIATIMSLCADNSTNNTIIYVSFYDSAGSTGYTAGITPQLAVVFAPQQIITTGSYLNLASAAQNGVCTVFEEKANNYSYGTTPPSHFINAVTVTSAGVVGTPYVVVRSVGLASKAFIVNGVIYVLTAYQSTYQPSYFLINGSTSVQASPVVVGKLAYSNGGGYLTLGLPGVTIMNGTDARLAYLFKDFVAAQSTVNTTPVAGAVLGVYSQTGINLGTFSIGDANIDAAEIAGNLNISGGFLWSYDGYYPVEQNFFVWPDNVEVTGSGAGGTMLADTYYYVAVYEWEDNQGNVYRSAPSIPVSVVTTGTTSSVTVNVPYLRLTYKIPNAAKIVIYRWSLLQQVFYRVTSLTAVQLNSTTSDSLAYVDTTPSTSITGNDILYTTGGVLEDVNAPATNIITLFDTRLWLVDAEDRNLLWFSKQVIENTPVEMSDLLTFYIAPTTASQGSTGPIAALAPMDDKLIIFKENAIYYINGTGPDNTGANNNYSQPIFITSAVGCSVQQSIVFTPQGLMFQSNKGIWLLGRDLQTSYIGAPVEAFNSSVVQSAVNVAETNQIRFTLDTGQTLMFDYYYSQWGSFAGVPAISSCVYQNLHTFINSHGQVYQETPGLYLDGSNPVLISFVTSWFNLAGLQGYQRAFFFYLLGQYYSPHFLNVQIAYDYNPSPINSKLIRPTNFSPVYGGNGSDEESPYGQQNPYGGQSAVENWRVFFKKQRCSAFQITLNEVYDGSLGVTAGAGLTLSGLNLVAAGKKGWRTISSRHSVGVS